MNLEKNYFNKLIPRPNLIIDSGRGLALIWNIDYKYTLRKIQSEFLPNLNEDRQKRKGRPKKLVYIHRERSLYQGRTLDLVKLCELRNYDEKGQLEEKIQVLESKIEAIENRLNNKYSVVTIKNLKEKQYQDAIDFMKKYKKILVNFAKKIQIIKYKIYYLWHYMSI